MCIWFFVQFLNWFYSLIINLHCSVKTVNFSMCAFPPQHYLPPPYPAIQPLSHPILYHPISPHSILPHSILLPPSPPYPTIPLSTFSLSTYVFRCSFCCFFNFHQFSTLLLTISCWLFPNSQSFTFLFDHFSSSSSLC